jgi:hypothetical protein
MEYEIRIYKPEKYEVPIAIDVKPSKELEDYHKNSVIQVNFPDGKCILKRCDSLNSSNK